MTVTEPKLGRESGKLRRSELHKSNDPFQAFNVILIVTKCPTHVHGIKFMTMQQSLFSTHVCD